MKYCSSVRSMAPVLTFTVFYCVEHDQGFLVAGDWVEPPENVNFCANDPARPCLFERHGLLRQAAGGVEVTGFDRDYDRYGGGWKYEYFTQEVYNEQGQVIDCPEFVVNVINNRE